jgi:hypothetical protein
VHGLILEHHKQQDHILILVQEQTQHLHKLVIYGGMVHNFILEKMGQQMLIFYQVAQEALLAVQGQHQAQV